MNEQLQAWLASTLERATSALEKGADVLGQQLPIVVQEFLTFHFIWYLVVIISILIVVFFWSLFVKRIYNYEKTTGYDAFGTILGSTLILVILIPTFSITLYKILMLLFAPRLFLIIEFTHLIK